MKADNTGKIKIVDTTLRDGSHAMSHQFNEEMISKIVKGLDEANVYAIEVSHGDGMGGSSLQYGFSLLSDSEMLESKTQYRKIKIGNFVITRDRNKR